MIYAYRRAENGLGEILVSDLKLDPTRDGGYKVLNATTLKDALEEVGMKELAPQGYAYGYRLLNYHAHVLEAHGMYGMNANPQGSGLIYPDAHSANDLAQKARRFSFKQPGFLFGLF